MELPKLYPQYPNRRNLMDYKQTWCKFVYNNLIINIVRRILLSLGFFKPVARKVLLLSASYITE